MITTGWSATKIHFLLLLHCVVSGFLTNFAKAHTDLLFYALHKCLVLLLFIITGLSLIALAFPLTVSKESVPTKWSIYHQLNELILLSIIVIKGRPITGAELASLIDVLVTAANEGSLSQVGQTNDEK